MTSPRDPRPSGWRFAPASDRLATTRPMLSHSTDLRRVRAAQRHPVKGLQGLQEVLNTLRSSGRQRLIL
jgi:hypothetical protein